MQYITLVQILNEEWRTPKLLSVTMTDHWYLFDASSDEHAVLALGVRFRVDKAVGDAAVVKGVGEAAGKDLVEDSGRAAGEVRIEDFHPGVDPGGGVLC